jgi:hypothetical protein
MKIMSAPWEAVLQFMLLLFRRILANFWDAASAETFCQVFSNQNLLISTCIQEILCVGIERDHLGTSNAYLSHAVDGIITAAAAAYNFDLRLLLCKQEFKLVINGRLLWSLCLLPCAFYRHIPCILNE